MDAPKKWVLGVATSVMALAVTGCSHEIVARQPADAAQKRFSAPKGSTSRKIRLIGDASTAYTGKQPHQPPVRKLAPGEEPPQFVVFSWDGAGQDSQKLFSHFRKVGKKYDAQMTYFLSGVYMLPEAQRRLYAPPKHKRGSSAIGFNDREGIRDTLEQIRLAWEEGNEIGTHFNGHFCGPDGGVGTWSTAEWKSEIKQAKWFVEHWRTTTGMRNEEPLPFDYGKELVGGRAPCLEGQRNLVPAAKEMGFRYDASSSGGLQVWPHKIDGIWNFPLQQVPLPGRTFETLSMDYNFLANQSGTVNGNPSWYAAWGRQMRDALLAGFDRAFETNRAPLFVGNHFESWNGGTYMRAVEDAIEKICPRAGVRCVTFKQLADWLDAQDPQVLAELRTLGVGEKPRAGWADFLGGGSDAPSEERSAPPTGSEQGPAAPTGADERLAAPSGNEVRSAAPPGFGVRLAAPAGSEVRATAPAGHGEQAAPHGPGALTWRTMARW